MDKRAFLAIALSILILVVYQEWVSRYYSTPTPTLAPEAEKKEPEKTPAAEQLQPAPTAPRADQAGCGADQPGGQGCQCRNR